MILYIAELFDLRKEIYKSLIWIKSKQQLRHQDILTECVGIIWVKIINMNTDIDMVDMDRERWTQTEQWTWT